MAITAPKKLNTKDSSLTLDDLIAETVQKYAPSIEEAEETRSKEVSALSPATKDTLNTTETENGAFAHNTTTHPLLDFFAQSGALRTRTETDIYNLFMKGFFFDESLAMKALFYARDIRGGQGERRTFRAVLSRLAASHPEAVARNIKYIPEYGRFDDLYCLVGTPLEDLAFAVIADQWNADVAAIQASDFAHVSLLGKWLKSENASSSETRRLANLTRRHLSLSSKEYRQSLSTFRNVLCILEKAMSQNSWDRIDYEKLPALAHLKHRAAFARHDKQNYDKYLQKVQAGKAQIKAATLYPYELVRPYTKYIDEQSLNPTIEAQWKALPNFLNGDDSFLVMVDVSGSMFPSAICSSVGLGIYFAEHARGAFANHFITFSEHPRLVEIPNTPTTTLLSKVKFVLDDKHCGYSTNLKAAFEAVLSSAVSNNVPASDMPRAIIAISDMEIDEATDGTTDKNMENFTKIMEKKFKDAGYEMPTLVYWNVEARQDTFHATTDQNVRFLSGQSASIFKSLCDNMDALSAVALMKGVLEGERYERVK